MLSYLLPGEGSPGFEVEPALHAPIIDILDRLCSSDAGRILCTLSERLKNELKEDKITVRYEPAQSQKGYNFLHLYFPLGPLKGAAIQLYCWLDKELLYFVGINTHEDNKLAIESIRDPDMIEIAQRVFGRLKERPLSK